MKIERKKEMARGRSYTRSADAEVVPLRTIEKACGRGYKSSAGAEGAQPRTIEKA